jgi:putative ubiquitin-RnfH superfamily antitoxin RatB of RatAB toxin-antitoxin module
MREITVTVVHALPDQATEITLCLPEGTTIAEAIARSTARLPQAGADLSRCPVGIFGQRARRDTVLVDGDRVELYRPLKLDPKQARRQRAANKKR